MPEQLTIIQPDDWHLHLRDNAALATTVPASARVFKRAIIMPNLAPPVTNVSQATAYRERILAQVPDGLAFDPLMTLYLTDNTSPADIEEVSRSPCVYACKLYPAGATTNSDAGVTDIGKLEPVLEAMQACAVPLLIHGEVVQDHVDIFDREAVFIDSILKPLAAKFPRLKIVLEHITTKDAVEFVRSADANVAATITAHHLLYNRNHMLVGGIRPHYYCLPILKRQIHQTALLDAAASGSAKFFLGTDSAPHAQGDKESACGCAGCFTAPNAMGLYAEAFEAVGALNKLEDFASRYGPEFYGLPVNTGKIHLIKSPYTIEASLPFEDSRIIPFRADETLQWQTKLG